MLINVEDLSISPNNPRKTQPSEAEDAALDASMKAHGQIVPIIIHPNGKEGHYEVIEGGRRLASALRIGLPQLKSEIYGGSVAAGELGTAANMMRAAMHPLDEARAIARQLADGDTALDVGLRFGQTERWVEQRQRLDQLSDRVKKAYRAGEITGAAAEAFTIGSRKQQDEYLKTCRADWQLEARQIRHSLTRSAIRGSAAIFDLDKYPASKLSRDLFGDDVWFTDREAFDRLQREHLPLEVESLQAEGWSDVKLLEGRPSLHHDHVQVEGKITKAQRARMQAFVIYDPASGEVRIERGWITRAEARALEKAQHPADDKAKAEEVKALTCYDLNAAQNNMVAALQTQGIACAIAAGDTWLALRTLLVPLLGEGMDKPAWAGLSRRFPNFTGANVTFDDKLEMPEQPGTRFPTRAGFEKMPWDEVMGLVRAAALQSIELMHAPDPEATKELAASGTEWFRYDGGFLRRYRLDALQDLAGKLKVPVEGLKKGELVKAILAHEGKPFLAIDWKERRQAND